MQLQYVCESVEASLPAAEGNHLTAAQSAPKQHDCRSFYQNYTKHSQTLTDSLLRFFFFIYEAGVCPLGFFPHPYCHSLEEKYPIPLSSHVEAHRATESIAQLHLQRFFFHGTFSGSHILRVSCIYCSPKPNTAHHTAPLVTSIKSDHYDAGFYCSVSCHPEMGGAW